ncbi:hypothetical protein DEJ48_39375 [Streptomyces venezuelae]|uniref:Uncharacterized protein n=1 Tax=Streptomyces venezuelae TaxID=54571 RepID=A0A5P2CBB3_STRVZ|nr:hypothetical protein DEJ48_39375 [Streptomyces venezuelae]
MISGNQTSSSSPESAAGTRTYTTRSRRLPAARTRARSRAAYTGTSTRSCTRAAPTNQSVTPSQSSARSRTPA